MRYTLAYFGFCAITIALLVFVNSTQPFVLSQLFGLKQNGTASSALALVDELVSLSTAPFWGALSDKVGTRHVAILGLLLAATGILLYPQMSAVYPYLLFSRALFSLGASAGVSMITASLGELSLLAVDTNSISGNSSAYGSIHASDAEAQSVDADHTVEAGHGVDADRSPEAAETEDGDRTVPLFASAQGHDDIFDAVLSTPRPNGKLAGMAGFASGVGAVLAVSCLLPLPNALGGGDAKSGIIEAFKIVSLGTVLVAFILFPFMYQNPTRSWRSFLMGNQNISVFDEAAVDVEGSVMSYFDLLSEGFSVARTDMRLQVAYFGSLVARSASVVLSLFVPLWVNYWYYDTGRCQLDDPTGCKQAITQAAILTGIGSTVMLLAAPVVGLVGDKYGSVVVLTGSAITGIIAMVGILMISSVHGFLPILVCSLLGASQIGIITMSMSMSTDQRRVAGGSVAGVYSLFGSLGILLITQFGGVLADRWIKTPFVIMTLLFILLAVFSQRLAARTALRSMH